MSPADRRTPRSAAAKVAAITVASLAAVALSGCGADAPNRPSAAPTATRTPKYSGSAGVSAPPATPTGLPSASDHPLAGKTIVLDPGHNAGNASHPAEINRKVDAGGFQKECDTTGTETDAGYAEHAFTFDVAQRTAAVLRARGAAVVLTRDDDNGVGPCIDQRAAAANRIPADVALSIHADGGPPTGKGFHVIRPGHLPGRGDDVVGRSRSLSEAVHAALISTGEPTSTYAGSGGYDERTDLGGLNLSTVPKVFVECGNMRNTDDASRLVDPAYRQRLAGALADGLGNYLFAG